jgi:hypothetical protein
MSLLFMEGFDDNLATRGKWTSYGTETYTTGRLGNAARWANGTNNGMRKVVAGADEHATMTVGFAFKPDNAYNNAALLNFISDTSATTHIALGTDINNALVVRRGATVLGTSSSNLIVPGTFIYIECSVVLHDTTGSVVVKVNTATVLNLTSVDTKNGGTKTVFEGIRFDNQTGQTSQMDDIYLSNGAGAVNTGFLGDVSVETLFPNGNGNSSQLLGSDADSVDNYLLVDEVTPNTTDYVGSGTDNQKDTYAFTNLVHSTGNIRGIQTAMYAAKSDSGARSMAKVIRSGGTDFDGADKVLSTSFTAIFEINETDPNTAAAWTIANTNAAEFGVKVRP